MRQGVCARVIYANTYLHAYIFAYIHVIDQVKGHFEARKALADKLQENASRVLALCR